MAKGVELISKTFNLKIGGLDISPTYWQAAAIIFLLFLLVLTLARMRYLYVNWALGRSATAMIFWGFLLAIVIEGFLLIGGRTLFTEILGWKNAPKPISTVLDASRVKLINVLGITEEIPYSVASQQSTVDGLILDFQNLSLDDAEQVRFIICRP